MFSPAYRPPAGCFPGSLLAALAGLNLLAGLVQAQIIASDDFSYPDGNLHAAAGGGGWSGAWVGNTYGTPTVAGGQAVIDASGTDARRVLASYQGPGTVAWLRFAGQQFTTAAAGVTNRTFGALEIFNGNTELGLIGKAWPGPYRWTLATGGGLQVSAQSTLSAATLYARVTTTTTNTMIMDLWVNPANPRLLDAVAPDASKTFSGSGWDSILLRAGSGESVVESWKFDDLVIASSLEGLWGGSPPGPPLLLAYEGFTNYRPGRLVGQTLGGPGFATGSWSGTAADAAAVTTNGGLTSLFYLAYGGGKATVKGDGSDTWGLLDLGPSSAFRAAGLYDTNSSTIGGGNISGALYLSFLFRAVSTNRDNEYGGLQLASGSNVSTGILIGNGTKAWAYSLYVPAAGTSVDLKNNGGAGAYLDMDNATHLLVARITYIPGANDSLTVWMDPDPAAGETRQPSGAYSGTAAGDFRFDRFALRGGGDANVPHPFEFDELRVGTTWATVLPPGPPPPRLTNGQISVTFNNHGGIHSMAVLRGEAWEDVAFRDDAFAGPAWKISDSSGTRGDSLTLTCPACAALTNTPALYTNVVFSGCDTANTNLRLALEYYLAGDQLALTASITNGGATAWSPTRAGILLGLDTYMASYPTWDYRYFPTLLRCEKTHFWGYAMTPLGRILGVASPNPVASWHNEYEGNGDRICTFGLDFLNQLPLPSRHPQNLTSLAPGQGMSWTVLVGDVPNRDPVSLDSVLPPLSAMANAPMIKANSYTGEPGETIEFTLYGNPVSGCVQVPGAQPRPLALVPASHGVATASFTLPATYGICTLLVTNAAGRVAEGVVSVRRPWSWYLQQARINALNKPQKDAGAQCEGYYGLYSLFLAKRWFPDPVLDAQSDAKFEELYPLMFSPASGLATYNTWRIQNCAAMAGVLADRFETDGNLTNLNRAAVLCDFLLSTQHADGGYYSGSGDYTSVIYPGKSIMEVMALERELGRTNSYWLREYTNHYNSVGRAMDHLARNLDNLGTEGEAAFEDGMISCSGAQLGLYALLQNNALARQKYLDAAAWFESAHRCLDQIVVPDARRNGGTERFWEDQFDILARPDLLCSPHGWSAWNIYGRWYLYQLTGNAEYLRQAMNALGACAQLIDPVSGDLRWAFCSDPFIPASLFANNPANTNPNTQGARISQVIGEQYLPMISGWCRAPLGTQVSEYSGNDGGCNDNDVHEIFKCLEEVALTSAYVVICADGSVETWNCRAIRTNSTLLVTPSESIVSRINVNAAVGTTVSLNFNGQVVTRFVAGISWQQSSPANDPYNLWRQAWFGKDYASQPSTLDAADYDHDGLPNLLEYLLGTDPTAPTPIPLPSKARIQGEDYYQWEIPVNSASAPAVPQIQNSPDLRHWAAPVPSADGNVIVDQGPTWRRVKLRASAFPASFFRIAGQLGQ